MGRRKRFRKLSVVLDQICSMSKLEDDIKDNYGKHSINWCMFQKASWIELIFIEVVGVLAKTLKPNYFPFSSL